jgi:replicative DNA helicase
MNLYNMSGKEIINHFSVYGNDNERALIEVFEETISYYEEETESLEEIIAELEGQVYDLTALVEDLQE